MYIINGYHLVIGNIPFFLVFLFHTHEYAGFDINNL